MTLVGRREGRNFGYGRQLSYAGPQALKDLFAGGHFATVKAHGDRWQAFVRWCRSEDGPGYNDARQIDRQTLCYYAAYLRQQIEQGELGIATAQNRLSSVSRTLAALRGDQDVRIVSPSQALELQRSTVRTRAPDCQDRQQVQRVLERLGDQHHERVAAIVLLARNESYAAFLQQTVRPARETLHKQGLKGFHELRAAYACERYEQLTGHAAPVNGGHCYRIDRDFDRQARQQISLELGHNRIDVVVAYIGGRA